MGIYIKNMEMPKNCIDCVFGWNGWCHRINSRAFVEVDMRRHDCPLVDVPPHGDLIDRDKLLSIWDAEIKALIDKGIEYCDGSWEDVYDSFVSDVKKIKTIIEAEAKK